MLQLYRKYVKKSLIYFSLEAVSDIQEFEDWIWDAVWLNVSLYYFLTFNKKIRPLVKNFS